MAAPLRPHAPYDLASDDAQMTLEQFLAWEEQQERRHEFVDGRPRAMTGGTLRHNTIVGNVLTALRARAHDAGRGAYAFDVQVRTPNGRVHYPDVVVQCGPFDYDDRHARTPFLIAEVTSPQTRRDDLGRKRAAYFEVPSLRAYLVVEQAVRRMECYVRRGDDTWAHREASDVTGVPEFSPPDLDAVLTLDQVYESTDVPAPPPDLRTYSAPPGDADDDSPA